MAYITTTQLARNLVTALNAIKEPTIVMQRSRPVVVIMPFDPEKHDIKLEPLSGLGGKTS